MIERRAARRPRPAAGEDGGAGEPSVPGRPSPVQDEEDEALLTAARRAAAEHQDQHGQPITRDALRARLGVSNQAASELLRQLRADQDGGPVRHHAGLRRGLPLTIRIWAGSIARPFYYHRNSSLGVPRYFPNSLRQHIEADDLVTEGRRPPGPDRVLGAWQHDGQPLLGQRLDRVLVRNVAVPRGIPGGERLLHGHRVTLRQLYAPPAELPGDVLDAAGAAEVVRPATLLSLARRSAPRSAPRATARPALPG
jgi:hypothetical protein